MLLFDHKIIPQQGTNKSAEAICATLKQQMINLKEEKDSLKAQLQHERGNILLVKSQYEDTTFSVTVLLLLSL
jgi:hypothetical protein